MSLNILNSNTKSSRKAKILPQFSISSEKKPLLDLLEIQRKSFFDFLQYGIPHELAKIAVFREIAKNSTCKQELELKFNPETYKFISPNFTAKEAILNGKTYACKVYVQATLMIRSPSDIQETNAVVQKEKVKQNLNPLEQKLRIPPTKMNPAHYVKSKAYPLPVGYGVRGCKASLCTGNPYDKNKRLHASKLLHNTYTKWNTNNYSFVYGDSLQIHRGSKRYASSVRSSATLSSLGESLTLHSPSATELRLPQGGTQSNRYPNRVWDMQNKAFRFPTSARSSATLLTNNVCKSSICKETEKQRKNNPSTQNIQIFRPWIFLGELPLMTKRGHFILNGSPRVIVNQIARCPGIYFQEKRRGVGIEQEIRVSADLIPQRGPWLRVQSDWEGRFWARLKQEGRVKYATLYEAFQEFEKEYNPPLICLLSNSSFTNATSSLFSKSETATFQERKIKEDRQKKALIRLFKNSSRYSLGKLGRFRVNERIHFTFTRPPHKEIAQLDPIPLQELQSEALRGVKSIMSYGDSNRINLNWDSEAGEKPVFLKGSKNKELRSFLNEEPAETKALPPTKMNLRVRGMRSKKAPTKMKGYLYSRRGYANNDQTSAGLQFGCQSIGALGVASFTWNSARVILPQHDEPLLPQQEELMAKDLDAIHTCLERLLEGQGFTDDIDNLKNRFIRTSGKLLQQQFELGLYRLNEVITPLLGNLLPNYSRLTKSKDSTNKNIKGTTCKSSIYPLPPTKMNLRVRDTQIKDLQEVSKELTLQNTNLVDRLNKVKSTRVSNNYNKDIDSSSLLCIPPTKMNRRVENSFQYPVGVRSFAYPERFILVGGNRSSATLAPRAIARNSLGTPFKGTLKELCQRVSYKSTSYKVNARLKFLATLTNQRADPALPLFRIPLTRRVWGNRSSAVLPSVGSSVGLPFARAEESVTKKFSYLPLRQQKELERNSERIVLTNNFFSYANTKNNFNSTKNFGETPFFLANDDQTSGWLRFARNFERASVAFEELRRNSPAISAASALRFSVIPHTLRVRGFLRTRSWCGHALYPVRVHFSGGSGVVSTSCLSSLPLQGFLRTRRFCSHGLQSKALQGVELNCVNESLTDSYDSYSKEVSLIKNAPFRWLRTSKPINSAFREFFGSNPLSQYMDQTNPLAEITHKRRLSSMGPGGIKRETAGMEVRGIHPTHYGRVCPIETPEGKNAGLVNSPTVYGRVGNYGFLETPLYQVIENQVQTKRWTFFSAQHEEKQNSSLATCDTGLLQFNFLAHVPIPVQTANNPLTHFQQIERHRVGYRALSPIQAISIATALIPFLEHDDANRALMGSNMQRQAIPLLSPERPIVGTGFEPLVVMESGQALQATKLGCVSQADANSIIVHTKYSIEKPLLQSVPTACKALLRTKFSYANPLEQKLLQIEDLGSEASEPSVRRKPLQSMGFLRTRSCEFFLEKKAFVNTEQIFDIPLQGFLRTRNWGANSLQYPIPFTVHFSGGVRSEHNSFRIPSKFHANLRFARKEFFSCIPPTKMNRRVWVHFSGATAKNDAVIKNRNNYVNKKHISYSHNTFLLRPLKQDLQFYERSNQETCLNQRPLVQEGDWIQKGDFLADSSASHSGDLALGKNVTVAYMPWEGYNFEDAIVISDRLVSDDIYTSLHIERYEIKVSKNSQGKERITNRVPGSSHSLKHLDNFGIARISSWVQPGDILVGKVVELKRPLSPYERLAWELASRLSPKSPEREKWLNKVWLEDISLRLPPGVCGRVINSQIISSSTEYASMSDMSFGAGAANNPLNKELCKSEICPQEVHLYLAVKRKIQIGDKLAGRHGNKGIVSAILPQEDMPYLGDGSCIDMVLNPLGVPSRMNLGQIFECLLGLAGSQLGCNFRITPFDEIAGGEASRSLVFLKLYQCRLMYKQQWLFTPTFPGKSKLFDGRTGEPFENWVTVGQAYMLKLIHMVDHKIHARSTGPYSLFTRQPVRGRSRRGGQRLGEMEVWAVEGFGAAYTLQEFLTIKSDDLKARTALQKGFYKQNDVTFGKIHIAPGNPEAFKVLVSELQALCLHIQM